MSSSLAFMVLEIANLLIPEKQEPLMRAGELLGSTYGR